jgi:acyl-coenzyme A thioesterase PaaI-like protein
MSEAGSTSITAEDDGIARSAAALRALQDAYSEASAPRSVLHAIARDLDRAAKLLARYAVPESRRIAGRRNDLAGSGQVLVPVLDYIETGAHRVAARVTCGALYLGSGGALHGGVAPLIFDDVLGQLAAAGGGHGVRTAYLHVNYRALAPVGVELGVTGRIDRIEGRKLWLSSELTLNGVTLADAEGLFVAART